MTDRMAALATLSLHDCAGARAPLADFYQRYAADALVIDKWFSLQAMIAAAGYARQGPCAHHAIRLLVRQSQPRPRAGRRLSAGNPTQFNRADGAGYDFIADTVLALDPKNPQLAARLATAFRTWRTLEHGRRGKARSRPQAHQSARPICRATSPISSSARSPRPEAVRQ